MSNAIHPLPDIDPFDPLAGTLQRHLSGAVCRGSFVFGSACGRCARCWADPMNPVNLERQRPGCAPAPTSPVEKH